MASTNKHKQSPISFGSKQWSANLRPLRPESLNVDGPQVTFTVDSNGGIGVFPVCRALLPDGNPYRLEAEAKGTNRHEVRIVNHDPAIVSYYTTSLHERAFRFEEHDNNCQQDYKTLIKLYALGEEMKDQTFQDHVMEALRHRLYRPINGNNGKLMPPDPSLRNAILIYESNPAGSLLRQFIRDSYAILGLPIGLHAGEGGYHAELLVDLVKMLDWYKTNRQDCKDIERAMTTGCPWPYFHSMVYLDV